mmetsp:Transcript_66466/g.133937  ORF Transcript_66466/g.133937 Transcript_66466/m.133937 type:complete len:144 (-) Transcript_66466:938-1369(-)
MCLQGVSIGEFFLVASHSSSRESQLTEKMALCTWWKLALLIYIAKRACTWKSCMQVVGLVQGLSYAARAEKQAPGVKTFLINRLSTWKKQLPLCSRSVEQLSRMRWNLNRLLTRSVSLNVMDVELIFTLYFIIVKLCLCLSST